MLIKEERRKRLLPNGTPRYVKCFDNGGTTLDRYTVIFTGRYVGHLPLSWEYLAMSAMPFHPQGLGQHGDMEQTTSLKHLGKRIEFCDLPEDCQKLVLQDYCDIWGVHDESVR